MIQTRSDDTRVTRKTTRVEVSRFAECMTRLFDIDNCGNKYGYSERALSNCIQPRKTAAKRFFGIIIHCTRFGPSETPRATAHQGVNSTTHLKVVNALVK